MNAVRKKFVLLALATTLGAGKIHALVVGSLNLQTQNGRTVLNVATRGQAAPRLQVLDKKLLLVIPGGERSLRPIKVNRDPLVQIRFGRHGKDLHVVLDLLRNVDAKLGPVSADGFSVDLGPAVADTASPKPKSSPLALDDETLNPAKAAYTYSVVDIALGGDEEHSELIISSNGPASYKPAVRDGGKLLVLTFRNSTLAFGGNLDKLKDDAVLGVSARESAEGGESKVQVEVRLAAKLEYALKRDQNQVLLRLRRPERHVETPRKGDLETPVSLDVQNADMVGVLKTLVEQAGFEYQFTKTMLGKSPPESLVTARVEKRPLREVLDTLLAQVQGKYLQQGNTLFIGSESEIAERQLRLPTVTRTYAPRYLSYSQLQAIIIAQYSFNDTAKARVTKGISQDPRDKSRLLLVGTAEEVRDWLDIAARFDVPESGEAAASDDGGSAVKTQVYRLQYLDAAHSALLSNAIQQLVPAEEETKPLVYQDPSTRTLVVTAKLKYLKKIEKLLARLDVRPPQVNIEGKIVEMNQSVANQLGINWTATQQQNSPKLSAQFDPGVASSFISQLSYATVQNGFDINARIQALVNESKADLVSAPNITVDDNTDATIETTDNLVIINTTQTVTSGVVTTNTTNSTYQIPLSLKVTPKISEVDRRVSMKITFTLSTATGNPPAAGAPPPTSEQKAETTVNVDSGDTAVIGGLVRQNNLSTDKKVPVLGDIPLLGLLFRYKGETKDKKEVIIFITPSIVEN
jgi:type II secretory pathway component GspD/PulD (secretin)